MQLKAIFTVVSTQRVIQLCKPTDKWMPSYERYKTEEIVDDQQPPNNGTVGGDLFNKYSGELRSTGHENTGLCQWWNQQALEAKRVRC